MVTYIIIEITQDVKLTVMFTLTPIDCVSYIGKDVLGLLFYYLNITTYKSKFILLW